MVKSALGKISLFLIRSAGFLFAILPRKVQLFLGAGLGSFLRLIQFRAKVVRQNLEYAFPQDLEARQRLFKQSYVHLGNLVFEVLMVFGFRKSMRSFVEKFVDLTGEEHLRAAQAKGKGLIYLSSHLGNWEVMATEGGLIGSHLMLVTKHLKPEWLHQAIEKGRLISEVEGTYEPRTLKDVFKQIKKNRTVGIVLDQYAGPPIGVRVPLFGIPVGTSLAVATIVKRTGATILPVKNFRKPDGRWAVVIEAPLEWKPHENPNYELALNTAHYASVLENHILSHPEQWLWTHRRFKGDLSPLNEGEWLDGRPRR